MVRDIHSKVSAPPALNDSAFLRAIDIHTEYRFDGHLELLVLRYIRELRISEGEVIGAMVGILDVVIHHRVQFERKDVEVEVEVVSLALIEK